MKQVTFNDQLLAVLDMTVRILAARVLSMVSLAMTFGLFCWAMWMHTYLALGTAGAFAILAFLPVLMGERKKEQASGKELPEG